MALRIETFNNARGGNAFFKAVTHPLAARRWPELRRRLGEGAVAIYDPDGQADALAELYDLRGLRLAGSFVQDLSHIGRSVLGQPAQPVTELAACRSRFVLTVAFDAGRLIDHIRHLLPAGAEALSLDALRIPDALLGNRARYLDPLNFATNFVFFRDAGGLSTRLVTANYWTGYGAPAAALWCLLYDEDGIAIAEWREELAPGMSAIAIDSRAVRRRFDLPEFTGQLFLHVVGAKGHDVVKYALDIEAEGTTPTLSATHDANAWPADYYAGLPAPAAGESVTLWVQNSQPCAIPAGAVALNLMGDDTVAPVPREIGAYATCAVDVASILPKARWPQQIEVRAGKYFVRPRYEVAKGARRRIAHVNVERTDLHPDPKLAELGNLLGKGYLLPAPVLPRGEFRTIALPTPMATTQRDLPVALAIYDCDGREAARKFLGRLPRAHATLCDIDGILNGAELPGGYGHLELSYDFSAGGEGDGWLHALFRYEHRASGHEAETSFGAHVFNTVLTYRGEPQSYSGRAPGLSTRLFLRLGSKAHDTICHLIYPASTPWHGTSQTDLVLHDRTGAEVARAALAIPCSGSRLFHYRDTFDEGTRARAGEDAYIIVRDTTCRLFGYHGLAGAGGSFSFDHMFGF
ncbi:MAG TPA: hypothetical protein VLV50_10160 [Stellaceae bacterium]|nr:hypothetical protein [Stellaceae bacterium]